MGSVVSEEKITKTQSRLDESEATLFRLIDEYHASMKQPDAKEAVIGAALEFAAATEERCVAIRKADEKKMQEKMETPVPSTEKE